MQEQLELVSLPKHVAVSEQCKIFQNCHGKKTPLTIDSLCIMREKKHSNPTILF